VARMSSRAHRIACVGTIIRAWKLPIFHECGGAGTRDQRCKAVRVNRSRALRSPAKPTKSAAKKRLGKAERRIMLRRND
jgi:hypothetical protein